MVSTHIDVGSGIACVDLESQAIYASVKKRVKLSLSITWYSFEEWASLLLSITQSQCSM
jgi:hypothetical protein